jgi:glycosyltransferase involved in cell wall biosynthesis
MKRIAVLLDGRITSDGRVQRIVHSLSDSFLVDLYCINVSDDDRLIFKNQNVKIIEHQIKHSWILDNLFFQKRFDHLKSLLLSHIVKYDLIYCNDYPLLEVSVEIKKELKTRLVYDSHEIYIETINQFFPTSGLKGWFYGKLLILLNKKYHSIIERKNLRSVDLMVTVCQSFSDFFAKKFGVKNCVVLRNCPKDVGRIKRQNLIRDIFHFSENDKILLYQGVINPGRGLKRIIDASKMFDKDIQFVILGDGPNRNELKNWVNTNGLNRVHFLDKVPFSSLLNYTASADIGILLIESFNLSKKLTLPNKVFEYMAAGIPFITNALPEASRIALEVDCGFVIDDSSSASVANEINDIFSKPVEKKGINGQDAIHTKYNWNFEFKLLQNEIDNLLNIDNFTFHKD